jgi:hypothetical protein
MSQTLPSQPSDAGNSAEGPGEPLQFDRAEFEAPADERPGCTVCQQPIADEYYEIHGKVMCPRCRHGVEAAFRGGSPLARVFLATAYGVAGAVAGTIVYYVWLRATNGWNLSLVSILVGFIVGKAVRTGTGNRGGSFYQALAIFLTYASLVAKNVLWELREVSLRALTQGFVDLFGSPLKEGLADPITGVIYALALLPAWTLNRPVKLVFNGPFRLGAAGPAEPAPEEAVDGA